MKNFRPGFALTAQAGFALVTVLALAYWQYSRGVEKSALADARDEMLALSPQEIRVDVDTFDFSRAAAVGRYDRERSFFSRSIRSGRPGYDVYTRFETSAGSFIVNRGWAPSPSRDGLPAVDPPAGEVELTGVVWPTAEVAPVQRQKEWAEGWPKRIGVVDVERMAQTARTSAREVRLDKQAPGVLAPPSHYYDLSAGTHWSYMVQWLTFGVAIVVGYVLIGRRQSRTRT